MIKGDRLKKFRTALLAWHQKSSRSFPWRRTKDPYRVLVAEVLLQQTFAKKVVEPYRELIRRYPTLRDLSRANTSGKPEAS